MVSVSNHRDAVISRWRASIIEGGRRSWLGSFLGLLMVLMGSDLLAADPLPEVPRGAVEFLQQFCLDCHQGESGEAGVDFSTIDSVDRFQKDRQAFESAMRVVGTRSMPPAEATQPEAAQRDAFLEAMQGFYRDLDAALPPQPGRVTMRRLNRTEYRNTIRDLIGVDFDPTEGFPSDDIGHGFDNVGEVLTLSPLLFERYLAASESIVSRAIVFDATVVKRQISARYTEPAAAEIPMVGNYRQLSVSGDSALKTGPIHTPYQWTVDGEYLFRAKLYKRHPGPLRVAVMLWGGDEQGAASDQELTAIVGEVRKPCRILKIVEITAESPETAERIEVQVPAMPGRDRMAIGIMRSENAPEDSALFVEVLELDGPLDPRPESHRRLLSAPEGMDDAARTRFVLQRFLRRAYRRPPSGEEVDRGAQRVAELMAQGQSWDAAMQWMIQATLCSPKFLFRVELDDQPETSEVRELDAFQVASRLSYFLWSSMPDDELLDLAQSGLLLDQLDEQVARMLGDPKADALIDHFAPQWLQIQRLENLVLDPAQFPQFNEPLKLAMNRETRLFFGAILRENRPVTELLSADFTFLNEPLAKLYGIADTQGNPVGGPVVVEGGEAIVGPEFRRVSLQGKARGGLVTMASVLAVTSNPTRTSPVKRGRWVLEQMLGAPPPPPPPNVPLLDEGTQAVASGSLRERLEIHRQNPACANCHAKMDPIGFALENFNAVGAFRTQDGEFPIDASGEFADGTKFQGVEDLKEVLLERRDDFVRCLTEKLMVYALGRGLRYYDRPTILKIERELLAEEDRFQVLIQKIVASPPFRTRGPYQAESIEDREAPMPGPSSE